MRTLFATLWLLIGLLFTAQGALAQADYGDLADRHRLQQTFPDGSTQPDLDEPRPRRNLLAPNIAISQFLLILLAVAIAGTFGFFIIRNALAYRRQNRTFDGASDGPSAPVEVWGTVPEDSWDALLDRLRLSGDPNTALHEMLLAAIGFCQKELAIHIPRAKTPREIRLSLPADFAGAAAFETLVSGAELAWFGAKPVDRPMFNRGLDALEQIFRLR